MRSQTATTGSSSVYSGLRTPSESTMCRYPSTTSSLSSLSYTSTVQTPVSSITHMSSKSELPAIPERYRCHLGRHLDAAGVPHSTRKKGLMLPAAYWRQGSLEIAPQVSQEEIRFWQGNSSICGAEPLRGRYHVSSSSSTGAIPPKVGRAPNRRNSRIEKRKRSYESLRKGKISMNDGTMLPTSFGGHSTSQSKGVLRPMDHGKGERAGAREVARRQSRTLVKKRQPWDPVPRCDRGK